jgi:hypothetical protein
VYRRRAPLRSGACDSVGTKQIKANAIVSSTIKNGAIHRVSRRGRGRQRTVADHTLLARDFKAGQLPAGQQGLPGPGRKGDAGATHLVVRRSSGHGISGLDPALPLASGA